jgi:hypothetical protein
VILPGSPAITAASNTPSMSGSIHVGPVRTASGRRIVRIIAASTAAAMGQRASPTTSSSTRLAAGGCRRFVPRIGPRHAGSILETPRRIRRTDPRSMERRPQPPGDRDDNEHGGCRPDERLPAESEGHRVTPHRVTLRYAMSSCCRGTSSAGASSHMCGCLFATRQMISASKSSNPSPSRIHAQGPLWPRT